MYYIPLIVIGFFSFFTALWCAVLSILSLIGGWNRLSKKFSAPEHLLSSGKEYTLQSARFRVVNYSLCMKVRVTETGIVLDVMKIFRFMHRPLFIPFSEMKDPSSGKFITKYIVFRLDNVRIEIHGSSAEEIRKNLMQIISS